MSAAPRPPALQVIADTETMRSADESPSRGNTDAADGIGDLRAQTVITQWDPEHQLVGALMHLSAVEAQPIVELVPATAIRRPMTRWAYEIISALAIQGRNPDPVIVLRTAEHQSPADDSTESALSTEKYATKNRAWRHHQLAIYLAEAYTEVITPTNAHAYAGEVLDTAYRRAFSNYGMRMQQLAQCGAERADLTEQFSIIRDDLAELWQRAEAAATPEPDQA
ncbi:hypothetical protein [Mycobacterium branderi]|uniref:DNA helicase DnaB-like N-terminal domain-containing protein n=1 Tax=Mycobacterium branderi TaxID=43348 RepID=A0A7I7WFS6_9MYCO|nr:hypothetical protein [Mycobacterium branderi]MCV7234566.1 hypothetical protein [Mycobacterium branderi]ORA28805.1 hypothetical protein BST20_28480 [Mycobacterium branderi]BBZ15353.1 hypothetical protein MBRA_55480 [Mycobacterium branderi]